MADALFCVQLLEPAVVLAPGLGVGIAPQPARTNAARKRLDGLCPVGRLPGPQGARQNTGRRRQRSFFAGLANHTGVNLLARRVTCGSMSAATSTAFARSASYQLRNPQMHQLHIPERQTPRCRASIRNPVAQTLRHNSRACPSGQPGAPPCAGVLNQPVLGHLSGCGNDGRTPAARAWMGGGIAYISNIQGSGTDRSKMAGPPAKLGRSS